MAGAATRATAPARMGLGILDEQLPGHDVQALVDAVAGVQRPDQPQRKERWLGGEDSNPQWQGQNLLCCRLHHPRTGEAVTLAFGKGLANPLADPDQPAEADNAPDGHLDRLFAEVGEPAGPLDGRLSGG
jgi:hypothetical protein